MGLNQYNLGKHLPGKFDASEASGSEEDFNIFLCISLVQTQDTLGRIHFGPRGQYLNKLG